MSELSFAEYLAAERNRLLSERAYYREVRDAADEKLAEINREFIAVDAYEAAKTGEQKPATNGAPRRARRGSIRETIMNLVAAAPLGLSRGEIIDHLGFKGDKSAEMSLSNALFNLTKNGSLVRESRQYHVAASQYREAAE